MNITLKDLIESKTESTVLTFFLLATPRAFGARELSSRLRIPSARINVALSNFTKSGHLKSFSRRGMKYYMLKEGKADLKDLKKVLLKTKSQFQDELFPAIKKTGQIRAAFLSGMFTGNPELPVDLLLVGKINLNALDKFLSNCKKMLGQEINYSIMSESEFKNRRDTFDRFIKDIFDYKHLVVVDNIKHSIK